MRTSGMTLGLPDRRNDAAPAGPAGTSLRGHEFHYSSSSQGRLAYACVLADAAGKPVGQDGVMVRNTLALYSHQHFRSQPEVVVNLLQSVRQESCAPSMRKR